MFGLGFGEICIIALATLIFYGPNKLPEFMRLAGRLFVQLRRMSGEVKDVVENVIKEAEKEMALEEAEKAKGLSPAKPAVLQSAPAEGVPHSEPAQPEAGGLQKTAPTFEEALAPSVGPSSDHLPNARTL